MIYASANYTTLTPEQQLIVRAGFIRLHRLRPADFWMEEDTIETASRVWAQALYKHAALYRRVLGKLPIVVFPSSCKGVKRPRRDPEDPEDPSPAPRDLTAALESVA